MLHTSMHEDFPAVSKCINLTGGSAQTTEPHEVKQDQTANYKFPMQINFHIFI